MKPSKSLITIALAAGSLLLATAPVYAQSDTLESANTATPPMANQKSDGTGMKSTHKRHHAKHHMMQGSTGGTDGPATSKPGTPSSHHGDADAPQGMSNDNGS